MAYFYDQLAPFYSLIYGDWEGAIAQQSAQLDQVIRSNWGEAVRSVLDVSCGIGTQALGLAALGYRITASDLSVGEVRRAEREAQQRGLDIEFSVCDMRQAHTHHQQEFDLVISCDNSVPHLVTDEAILEALRSFYACLRPGGGCILTLRDYDQEPKGRNIVKPYGIREADGKRYLLFQVWDFEGHCYDLSFYVVEDDLQTGQTQTHVMRSRYYAISPNHLMDLMKTAGFTNVARFDEAFFQPLLVGTK